MPISPIAAPVNKAAHIRNLGNKGLSVADIRELTGYRLPEIKAALGRAGQDKRKSKRKVEARGPLTAGDLAAKLRDGSAGNGLN